MSTETPWLTVYQAAARVQASKGVIYGACRAWRRGDPGGLRHSLVGGRRDIRVRAEWIDEWLEASAKANAPKEVEPVGRWRAGAR